MSGSIQEWESQRARLRYEILDQPNLRVLQWHRNEWPKLWEVLDEITSDSVEDTWIGNPEDMPIPEVPMVATFEDDELVGMEELPEIPEPGQSPDWHPRHSPIDPGETKADRGHPYDEEFSLPEGPE